MAPRFTIPARPDGLVDRRPGGGVAPYAGRTPETGDGSLRALAQARAGPERVSAELPAPVTEPSPGVSDIGWAEVPEDGDAGGAFTLPAWRREDLDPAGA
jgi:hypothetical protein